ncbi:ribosome-binding protein 1-like [Ptychodera flava]|uniref:ribosome-binding protein 1-like n=1 Tax=Ptychodera flava TaxID=63121 RepID=UPI00396A7345
MWAKSVMKRNEKKEGVRCGNRTTKGREIRHRKAHGGRVMGGQTEGASGGKKGAVQRNVGRGTTPENSGMAQQSRKGGISEHQRRTRYEAPQGACRSGEKAEGKEKIKSRGIHRGNEEWAEDSTGRINRKPKNGKGKMNRHGRGGGNKSRKATTQKINSGGGKKTIWGQKSGRARREASEAVVRRRVEANGGKKGNNEMSGWGEGVLTPGRE